MFLDLVETRVTINSHVRVKVVQQLLGQKIQAKENRKMLKLLVVHMVI